MDIFTSVTTDATNFTTHTTITNTTIGPPEPPYPVFVGYICAFIAVIMYGSNFVPIKKFYTGDGMFFQWILCSGVFVVGIVVQIIRQSSFHPIVMMGGAIWTTGNLCVVPIVKTIGLGLGMSIWGTFGLVTGWASGRFGWFDTTPNEVSKPFMNYFGVGLAFCSILLYVLVKNEVSAKTDMEVIVDVEENTTDEEAPLIKSGGSINSKPSRNSYTTSTNGNSRNGDILVYNSSLQQAKDKLKANKSSGETADDKIFIENFSPMRKRIIGTVLSVFSGIMYGINFTPSIYVKEHYSGASQNDLDYTFAQFVGIYAASSVYFFLYCAFQKNKPKVYPSVILPGIVSGIMWGIATTCWFIANAELSEAISFPIVSTAPCAIASLFWGVLVFHEVKGVRNILILVLAFCVMATGVILAGLSR
ncbi:transmembrane protein 144 [Biomphalaria glabrata]|nr:transmembrane protein 144 [Biomphalaria glabrata]